MDALYAEATRCYCRAFNAEHGNAGRYRVFGSWVLNSCGMQGVAGGFFGRQKEMVSSRRGSRDGGCKVFCGPPGDVNPSGVAEGWGLLEIHDRMVSEKKAPERKKASKRCEVKLLMSAIRRLELSTAVFVVQDVIEEG